MASSGSFQNLVVSGGTAGLYCEWSGARNNVSNYTAITVRVYMRASSLNIGARTGAVVINGVSKEFTSAAINDTTGSSHNILLTTQTVNVSHDSHGLKNNVALSVSWNVNSTLGGSYYSALTASTSVNLDRIALYTMSISSGEGANISVYRVSSTGGVPSGHLSNGSRMFYGDVLRITFSANAGYELSTQTVNGSDFVSGSTYTVGDYYSSKPQVSVVALAEPASSTVAASGGLIVAGNVMTIEITKRDPSYYVSLRYRFNEETGYISSDGYPVHSPELFNESSISFHIPESFLDQLPERVDGVLFIYCTTYTDGFGTEVVGTETRASCTMSIDASIARPVFAGEITELNDTVSTLVNDEPRLIKYVSSVAVGVRPTAYRGATIVDYSVNGVSVPPGSMVAFTNVSTGVFTISARDSRGFTSSITSTHPMLDYTPVTFNASFKRQTPTSSVMQATFSGLFFNGYFDSGNINRNTLTIQYQYREDVSGSTWSSLYTVPPTSYTIGTKSFKSGNDINMAMPVSISGTFDYNKSYVIKFVISDGIAGTPLTTIEPIYRIASSIPVFDWGKEDFEFNVPVALNSGICSDLDPDAYRDIGDSEHRWGNAWVDKLHAGILSEGGYITWEANQDFHVQMHETNYGFHYGVWDSMWTLRPEIDRGSRLGCPTYRWNQLYAGTATINTSDRNQKKNINDLSDKYIDMMMLLAPVSFQFKDNESGRTHVGFIAQDVEAAMEKVGLTDKDFAGFCKDKLDDGREVYGLRYEEFIAINTAIIQKQQKQIIEMSKDIEEIKRRLK